MKLGRSSQCCAVWRRFATTSRSSSFATDAPMRRQRWHASEPRGQPFSSLTCRRRRPRCKRETKPCRHFRACTWTVTSQSKQTGSAASATTSWRHSWKASHRPPCTRRPSRRPLSGPLPVVDGRTGHAQHVDRRRRHHGERRRASTVRPMAEHPRRRLLPRRDGQHRDAKRRVDDVTVTVQPPRQFRECVSRRARVRQRKPSGLDRRSPPDRFASAAVIGS